MRHVVLCRYRDSGKYLIQCKRCMETQDLPSPLDAVNFLRTGDEFEKNHKDCRGRKKQTEELPMFMELEASK